MIEEKSNTIQHTPEIERANEEEKSNDIERATNIEQHERKTNWLGVSGLDICVCVF